MQAQIAYAGFWLRFGAMMIDSILLTIVIFGTALVFGLAAGFTTSGGTGVALGSLMLIPLMGIGSWLYFAICEASAYQATLGKRAVGLIVTDLNGDRISFGRALGRLCSKLLNSMSFGIGWIMAGFTDRKQALHDFVAGTLVIKRDPTRNSTGVVIACVCVGSIPFIGIVAAIAVPGLLRARMVGNETAAIRTMQTITSAQLSYFSRCGGYAPTLTALSSERAILGPELAATAVVTSSGYRFSMKAANAATPVTDAPAGCDGAVSDYIALAAPVTPGSSGRRYFGTDGRAEILEGDVEITKTDIR
jgi:uncharacterized RDD family membrane protein YckC